ncbi:hypothetical protein C0991_004635, partial [Blastosporella zonata]
IHPRNHALQDSVSRNDPSPSDHLTPYHLPQVPPGTRHPTPLHPTPLHPGLLNILVGLVAALLAQPTPAMRAPSHTHAKEKTLDLFCGLYQGSTLKNDSGSVGSFFLRLSGG